MLKKVTNNIGMKTKEIIYREKLDEVFRLKDLKKFDEAIYILNDLIKQFSKDYILYALIGGMFFMQDKYEEALSYFEKVLKLKPKSEKASAEIFHCLNGLGRGDDALKEMIRFLNSVDELKKDSYKWILEDLLKDINNPQLDNYRNSILTFKDKFKIEL
jgi:tetratricopeptide (TPR) repeat protein